MKLGVSEELTPITYMKGIKEAVEETGLNGILIILEPGNSLIYRSIEYITKVIDVKLIGDNCFATLDGSRIHTDPLFRKKNYLDIEIKSFGKKIYNKVYLCGFTCKETDRFTVLFNQRISVGDYISFKKIGAYTMSMVPAFIEGYPRVYIMESEKVYIQQNKSVLQ